ncbi:hypothetical protein BDB00DRAFT_792581 [Zychaea mexicana]|uniref:uncharacterized protein n=1 Tax=Zychaea mexicana TaxID=64656 RepID=UPI0022FEA2DA|nr:uncharacterized protein BDB00DRAFT_792581 [Zychaea mexicana]KAI9484796.1 hypothetical protein BDB00DRAFT_792581 [Zychaea mexicana]
MALNVQMNAVAYAYALDMIDLAPTCGKGYLRLASVYMQIGQHHYAVEAYHQGLLAVPRSDPYYGTLQDRYENEQGQLCDNDDTTTGQQRRLSRKKYNSIPVPRHIFISIFENLDFADRRRCMAVCKHWRIYLQDWPNMWESVDIRNPPRYHADRPASQRLWNSYQLYMRSKPIKSVVLYNADSITWIRYSTTIKSIICHGGSISPDLDLSSAGTQLKTLELHRVQGVTFADVLNSGIMKRGYLERLVYHPYSNDNGNDDDNVVQEIPCSLKQHQDVKCNLVILDE